MGRPKGSKTRSPVKADEEYAEDFAKNRVLNGHMPTLTPLGENDREYLMGMFQVFRSQFGQNLSDKKPNGGSRYSPKQMFDNVMQYFEVSIRYGQPLTVTAIGRFCRIDKSIFWDLIRDEKTEEDFSFIKDCIGFVEMYNEYAMHKKQNPAGPIFALKNFGWKDKIEVSASATIGAMTDEEREKAQKRLQAFSEERIIDIKKLEEKTQEKVNS